MKKKRFGEDTVCIRVPASRKNDVLEFLKRFEVINHETKVNPSNPYHQHYLKGYFACYEQWEQYHLSLPFFLAGCSDLLPAALDFQNGNVPESLSQDAIDKFTKGLKANQRNLSKYETQLREFDKMIDLALLKGHETKVSDFPLVDLVGNQDSVTSLK